MQVLRFIMMCVYKLCWYVAVSSS